MPALPSLKQCQAQPTQAQSWEMLAGTRACLPGPQHPALPGCPLVGAVVPCIPLLEELRNPGAGGHGSLGPECWHVLLCFSR